MSALDILPHGVTEIRSEVTQCNDETHRHKNPTIERVTFRVGGKPGDIETEQGSGRFNIRYGIHAIFGATTGSAKAWLNKHIHEEKTA